MDPLKYGWKKWNGYYTPDWYLGPDIPDDLFLEGEPEDVSINQPDDDVTVTALDDAEDAQSETWSDSDSDADT